MIIYICFILCKLFILVLIILYPQNKHKIAEDILEVSAENLSVNPAKANPVKIKSENPAAKANPLKVKPENPAKLRNPANPENLVSQEEDKKKI